VLAVAAALLAFAQPGAGLVETGLDGTGARIVAADAPPSRVWSPAFSADGRLLAFGFGPFGQSALMLANADGSGAHAVVTSLDAEEPAFSPDGTTIAFTSYRAGGRSDVWVVGVDGSGLRRLASGRVSSPAWSPFGTLAWVREVYHRTGAADEIEFGGRRLGDGEDPAFSPDGRRIAFSRDGDIFSMRADGRGVRRLTRGRDQDGAPRYAPDGRSLVFERRVVRSPSRFSGIGVWLMDASGLGARRVAVSGRRPVFGVVPLAGAGELPAG
jgi:Tol biopolymer transport system component